MHPTISAKAGTLPAQHDRADHDRGDSSGYGATETNAPPAEPFRHVKGLFKDLHRTGRL